MYRAYLGYFFFWRDWSDYPFPLLHFSVSFLILFHHVSPQILYFRYFVKLNLNRWLRTGNFGIYKLIVSQDAKSYMLSFLPSTYIDQAQVYLSLQVHLRMGYTGLRLHILHFFNRMEWGPNSIFLSLRQSFLLKLVFSGLIVFGCINTVLVVIYKIEPWNDMEHYLRISRVPGGDSLHVWTEGALSI